MVVDIENIDWRLTVFFCLVESPNLFFYLAKFGVSGILYYVVSQLWRTSKLLVDFEDKLLRVDFSVTIIFVHFEKSLVITCFRFCILKVSDFNLRHYHSCLF